MSEPKHSSIPWKHGGVNQVGLHGIRIVSDGFVIIDVWFAAPAQHAPSREVADANAEVLIKAVNSHDRLLAENRELKAELARQLLSD